MSANRQDILQDIQVAWEESGRDLTGEEVQALAGDSEESQDLLDEIIESQDILFDGTGHVFWVDA